MAKSSSTAQSVTLVSILAILLAFGTSYLFIIPQLVSAKKDLTAAQSKSAGLTQDQQALQSAEQQLTAAEQALSQKGVNLNAFSAIYPSNEDMPDLYIQLDNLMAAAGSSEGVSATYTVGNPVANTDQTAKVALSFTATGSYPNLLTFFTLLETNIRPIIISQISFAPAAVAIGSSASTPGQLTASLSAYTLAGALSSAYIGTATP